MTYESFWSLHDKVGPQIDGVISKYCKYCQKGRRAGENYKSPPIPIRAIPTSVRLALALHYFAGAEPTDLMCKYGLFGLSLRQSRTLKNSTFFEYPSSHEEQL
jgi:hypothetical protein